jgi:uncharacterized damage-inducible protein DinB
MTSQFLDNLQKSATLIDTLLDKVSEEQAAQKPNEKTWSMLECLEHIFIVEAGIIKTLRTENPPSADSTNTPESVINRDMVSNLLQNRTTKIDAPDFTAPKGRFKSLEEAKMAFLNKRTELTTIIKTANLNDGFIAKHPRLGDMTKSDWVHFLIQHTDRHVEQLAEIKQQITQ